MLPPAPWGLARAHRDLVTVWSEGQTDEGTPDRRMLVSPQEPRFSLHQIKGLSVYSQEAGKCFLTIKCEKQVTGWEGGKAQWRQRAEQLIDVVCPPLPAASVPHSQPPPPDPSASLFLNSATVAFAEGQARASCHLRSWDAGKESGSSPTTATGRKPRPV